MAINVDPRKGSFMLEESLPTEQATPGRITFTRQQLDYLEAVFPEIAVGSDAMSDAKIRYHLGQRSVIAHVRGRVR